MQRHKWLPWVVGGAGLIGLIIPGGRTIVFLPGGIWIVFLTGFFCGVAVAGWWANAREGEPDLLRRRLVRGEIRLAEYRLLCRELGIAKKNYIKGKKEEDFAPTDGT